MAGTPARYHAKASAAKHESFLRYASYRWLKIATALIILVIAGFDTLENQPGFRLRHLGGSWYGYASGILGAFLILWLTGLGIRKRAMTDGSWSLKAWVSAHVYLGLSLVIIVTLHTGFQFGWNVHTLAYALMMLVIVSGLFGVFAYGTLPRALSDNRGETTEPQMLEALRSIDRQLHEAAQPLRQRDADLVRRALEEDPFGGGLWARLTGHYRHCATRAAQVAVRLETGGQADLGDSALERIDALLEKRAATLARIRRHLRIKGLLEIWLYVHVPMTFALIAALSAHIVSVFFYW